MVDDDQFFEFTVFARAVPKYRPRICWRQGIAYTPERTVNYEQTVAWYFNESRKERGKNWIWPLQGPIEIEINCIIQKPKKLFKSFPRAPDCDNAAKSVLDALNKLAWEDDSQITDLRCTKTYGDQHAVRIKFRSLTGI